MEKFTKDNLRNTFGAIFTDSQVKNINKLYDYTKNTLKWTDKNIAAVLGNVMQESSFNYGQISSAGAKGAFLFLGDRLRDYNKWLKTNGYKDGALSLATYLNYVINNKIDPRMDMVNNAYKLLENKNSVDSINAYKVLDWAEFQLQNGTFYPIAEYYDKWHNDSLTLEQKTKDWANYIEKSRKEEVNLESRVKYANGFYKIMSKKFGGIIDFLKNGSDIHIKKKNEGKFTKSAKAAGESVQEHAHKVMNNPKATPLQRKRANFAILARKWKHFTGGKLNYLNFFN